METNIELLNYIYQNAEMGKDSTEHLLKICEDNELKKVLQSQLSEYKKVFDIADNKIKSANKDPKELSSITKLSTDIMLNLKTLKDKSSSHISEMMIQGSTMGIIDITKKLNEYNDASKYILDLGKNLLKFQQEKIEEFKKFLK